MKPKTFILYKGFSQYNVHHVFVDQLALAITTLGHKSIVVDFTSPNLEEQASLAFSQDDCAAIISFNAIGHDYYVKGEKYNSFELPFFAILVDHPIKLWPRLKERKNSLIVSCIDHSHVNFVERYLYHHTAQTFLPHGGCQYSNINTDITARPIDIAFFGSITPPEKVKESWVRFPFYLQQLLDLFINNMIESHPTASDNAALYILQSMGYEDTKELQSLLPFLIYHGEEYLWSHMRLECIKTLDQANIPIHVYGKGWKDLEFQNIKVHPPVDFMQTLNLMQQSKIVLNCSPTLPEGSHERVFSSMLNGAVALTDNSKFYKENFLNNKNIVRYSWQELESLPDIINNLLAKPKKMQNIATRGQEKAFRKHSWINRAQEIINVVETCSSYMLV
jgi:hypothetical protein